MDETSPQKKSVKVSGHLEDKRGFYHVVLSWKDETGNRGRKSISTGLPVKGNKKRAEGILHEKRKEQETLITSKNFYRFLDVIVQNDTVRAGFEPAWVAPNGFQDRRVMTASLPHHIF